MSRVGSDIRFPIAGIDTCADRLVATADVSGIRVIALRDEDGDLRVYSNVLLDEDEKLESVLVICSVLRV